MNVASLERCRELNKLSGWDDTENVWSKRIVNRAGQTVETGQGRQATRRSNNYSWAVKRRYGGHTEVIAAYDLGYLLRVLPPTVQLAKGVTGYFANCKHIAVEYEEYDTPEDALCELGSALFRHGVLVRRGAERHE